MATRTQIASDSFTGTDGTAINTSNWADINNSWGTCLINGNRVYGGSGQGATSRWIGAGTFTNDQYASIVIGGLSATSEWVGVIVRCGSGTNAARNLYLFAVSDDSIKTTYLVKIVAGTSTTLYSATAPWVNGDRIELEVEGTTLRGMRNGVALGGNFTQTGQTDLTTGQPGIWTNSPAHIVTGDDWQAGSLTAAAGGILYPAHMTGKFQDFTGGIS